MRGDDRGEVLARVARRPYFVTAARDWTVDTERDFHVAHVRDNLAAWLDAPKRWDVLLGESGFLILCHGQVEKSTQLVSTEIVAPSWPRNEDGLLARAVERAREQGAQLITVDLLAEEHDAQACYEASGFVHERNRIVRRLFPPPSFPFERAVRNVRVRPGVEDDRFALIALATSCVPHMLAARERPQSDAIVARFFEEYMRMPIGPEAPHRLWIGENTEGVMAGALLVDPKMVNARDGRSQAFIYDLSVTPQLWGRAVGAGLVIAAIAALSREGVGYFLGDISVDNTRVATLADRFGFVTETRRLTRIL